MNQKFFLVSEQLLVKILNALNDGAVKGSVAIALELNACKKHEEPAVDLEEKNKAQ
ncbi:MAG: hypothetical protein BWZ03_00088 [bacterium ADurb.BinA186]|nr:MAG: hypothetical protein BWZ03_00088 [bacterium ADurb.BinA186]